MDVQLPEAARLAETIQARWPAILVALNEDASNTGTDGFKRVIKQTKQVGCGYRTMINY
jgi:Transposase